MIHPSSNSTKDVRGVFIIDPSNIVQAIFFYPNNVGRNIEELKRTLVALQATRDGNVLTPANWQKGDDVLVPFKPGSGRAKAESEDVSWFMTFRKIK